ncbi:MAG: AarF/ABC1/UbiB kinase family protein [Bacteriovoracaceae bacterium]
MPMDVIRAGIGITKTIRNVTRLKEIVLVFAKHGLDEFITLGVTSKIPNFVLPKSKKAIREELQERPERDVGEILGMRLRQCFEELGPAFIKFGQLLSTRDDVIDSSFTDQMKLLRDKVRPIPLSEVRQEIERRLGKKIEEVFSELEEHPIGTASIGIVYRGTLLSGERVVLKVRRPGIEKIIDTDFSILNYIFVQAERVSEELRYLGISRVLKDFSVSLQSELNFNIEALNSKRLAKVIEQYDDSGIFYFPKVYEEYTSESLLLMEFMEGIPFTNSKEIANRLSELEPKFQEGIRVLLKGFLMDGFFHADLHGGNFFLRPNNQIGLIDFGLIGTLTPKSRKSLMALLFAIINFDFEKVVYEFLDVAEYEKIPDIDNLISDVRDALSPYVGLTLQQISFGALLKSTLYTLKSHLLFLPREWFIVFRALITLEGVGKSIGVDTDILSLVENDIRKIIQQSVSKEEIIEESLWAVKDVVTTSRSIPRHIKWFLRELSKNGYAIELKHNDLLQSSKNVQSGIIFFGYIFMSCTFLFCGLQFIDSNISDAASVSKLTWVFWFLALGAFFKAARSLK